LTRGQYKKSRLAATSICPSVKDRKDISPAAVIPPQRGG
jgi:hypothetical protein